MAAWQRMGRALKAHGGTAEVGHQLKRAQKKIADLLEDIGRLSDELQRKDSLLTTLKSRLPALSSWVEITQTGELQHHSAMAALRDTVIWEPSSSTCQRPSCSTPSGGTPWSEVAIRSRKRAPGGAPCGGFPFHWHSSHQQILGSIDELGACGPGLC